ncbi:hypothetical protein [Sphingobacterium paucimobilis]|uniref:Uncharacterized protein n=1 Tax=Sphingobacterium paucimobilis HER1398 TaxID=1346330 RepID=U2J4K0_9SPHI|nr:hypothetical protein [Sphingobacterium paucimobilis]ERJ57553.1 hypothetical protein M472_02115 [Sphingobacterium paucimobilis HER1398]
MGKIIIIGILLAVLIYFTLRRLNFFNFNKPSQRINSSRIIEVTAPTQLLKRGLKRTLYTVGSGLVLLILIVALAAKFKIALIMLPISIYLIAQFFVLNNHVKTIRDQQIHYDSETQDVHIEWINGKSLEFNLLKDVTELKEVRAVQKNNGLHMGYYQLSTNTKVIYLPYLLQENPVNKPFFDKLQLFNRSIETKLFPII